MMNPHEDNSIKHIGKHVHRFSSNPREWIFAEEWRSRQKTHYTLQWLLCASEDQQNQEREITQVEATCAATLMQWLGSPVGYKFLQDVLTRIAREEK